MLLDEEEYSPRLLICAIRVFKIPGIERLATFHNIPYM
jgi:hypothetical protein